jgi:hypothetical protein
MNPLVCLRKESGKPPPVPSVGGVCDVCSASVWVAASSPAADTLWCWECAAVMIAQSEKQGKPVIMARPTAMQLLDLAAHWNKR